MSSSQQQSQTPQPAPSRGNNRRGRGRRPPPSGRANQSQEQRPRGTAESPDQPERSTNKPNPQSTRARKFGGQLTTSTSTDKATNAPTKESKSSETREAAPHMRSEGVNIPDLTAKLMNTLKSPPYAECVICFAPIIPQQPTWACTVSEETNRCCWGVFHNKCIVAWSKKSMQETKAAFQARNEDRDGEWRCPGCQTVRTQAPGQYKCFCGAVADPKPGRKDGPGGFRVKKFVPDHMIAGNIPVNRLVTLTLLRTVNVQGAQLKCGHAHILYLAATQPATSLDSNVTIYAHLNATRETVRHVRWKYPFHVDADHPSIVFHAGSILQSQKKSSVIKSAGPSGIAASMFATGHAAR
ncbi:hypothetical protein M408DRAFT_19420 [Serendipita vermifera MAFF 305830]|uniref:Uncharacterized protein n=1 Tax=Serendipita vermifera MAFF 305830 TaxID=933852 RepID=A0A0C3BCH2_SERVB|nr:hypothetical protein M408DRAFT_19420 [Serendipita vermifera MAFF 305830]